MTVARQSVSGAGCSRYQSADSGRARERDLYRVRGRRRRARVAESHRLAGRPRPRHRAGPVPAAERANYGEVVLSARLRDALARLNPTLPTETLEEAYRKLTRPERAELIRRKCALHY